MKFFESYYHNFKIFNYPIKVNKRKDVPRLGGIFVSNLKMFIALLKVFKIYFKNMKKIKIGNKFVGDGCPFYTIAEIGSNFDKSLSKAKKLVDLAIKSGADAVKFQSFKAEKLVNDDCFKNLKIGYQSKWDKSVFDVYKGAEFPIEFHKEIFDYCKEKGTEFFSAPYDKESVDYLDELGVNVFKIGSGDITWLENIEYIAKKISQYYWQLVLAILIMWNVL